MAEIQQYLVKPNSERMAHIWTGDDTLCRMASTGGLRRDAYQVVTDRGSRRICGNCENGVDTSKYASRSRKVSQRKIVRIPNRSTDSTSFYPVLPKTPFACKDCGDDTFQQKIGKHAGTLSRECATCAKTEVYELPWYYGKG